MEYELLDTGVFHDDRYFDVFVEYAKSAPEDILVRITAVNRGPAAADLHLLPTLLFRNDWSKWIAESNRSPEKPHIKQVEAPRGATAIAAAGLGVRLKPWIGLAFGYKGLGIDVEYDDKVVRIYDVVYHGPFFGLDFHWGSR